MVWNSSILYRLRIYKTTIIAGVVSTSKCAQYSGNMEKCSSLSSAPDKPPSFSFLIGKMGITLSGGAEKRMCLVGFLSQEWLRAWALESGSLGFNVSSFTFSL